MVFGSHADRVVQPAVALVNELTAGLVRGRPMPDLTTGARQVRAGAVVEAPVTPEEAEGLTRLAERLRPVFAAAEERDVSRAAELVNGLLAVYRPQPYLARHDGESWHLHFHAAVAGTETAWGAGCAAALASIVGGESWRRLGVCSAPACDRVFVDLSRNGSRRFCSAACQNRTKAAALRARRRAAG
ncbi:MAG TPA: CGNR zinc finger domain-containing protein [Candidatus Dormibacteraeota bacterium]